MWTRLQKDPTRLLSHDPRIHMENVKKGLYIYMVDQTTAELALEEDSSLDFVPSDIMPMQFAIGLPFHAAYTDDINQM